jgi:Ca2+-binding RTX toxin-like protein
MGPGKYTLSGIQRAALTAGPGNDLLNAALFFGPATLTGGSGNDTLLGSIGNDVFTAGSGKNRIAGGPGVNTLVESGGSFTLTNTSFTGLGTDTLSGIQQAILTTPSTGGRIDASAFSGATTLVGSAGNDTLLAGAGNSSLVGGGGNDSIVGGKGNDTLSAGQGNSTLQGGGGTNLLSVTANVNLTLTDTSLTGLGTDVLSGIQQASLTAGNASVDFNASAFSGPVTLTGGAGNDTLLGGLGNDVIVAGPGNNLLSGGGGTANRLVASGNTNFTLTNASLTGPGTSVIGFFQQASLTDTGPGNHVLDASGFGGKATLTAGSGNDTLVAGLGPATLIGGGNDVVEASGDVNFTLTNTTLIGVNTYTLVGIKEAILTAGPGSHLLNASLFSGAVVLVGGAGNDTLIGGTGRDVLIGGGGADHVVAGSGGDIVIGGTTDFDANGLALAAVLAEWARTDISYLARINHLTGPTAGLNGTTFLTKSTVHGDNAQNLLFGGIGQDWFFKSATDTIFGLQPGEVVTPI